MSLTIFFLYFSVICADPNVHPWPQIWDCLRDKSKFGFKTEEWRPKKKCQKIQKVQILNPRLWQIQLHLILNPHRLWQLQLHLFLNPHRMWQIQLHLILNPHQLWQIQPYLILNPRRLWQIQPYLILNPHRLWQIQLYFQKNKKPSMLCTKRSFSKEKKLRNKIPGCEKFSSISTSTRYYVTERNIECFKKNEIPHKSRNYFKNFIQQFTKQIQFQYFFRYNKIIWNPVYLKFI